MKLINNLIDEGTIKTPAIISAFKAVSRQDFLPPESKHLANQNRPIPIGHGVTNSQPYTVAFMLELLQPQAGQKILDIGSGSAWQTVLLAHIVGDKGSVYAIERIPEIKRFGEQNAKLYNFKNISFYCQDGSHGLPNQAPFDRIVVAAAAAGDYQAIKQQLKVGGRLVIPTAAQDIRLIIRESKHNYREQIFPGFVFVPLISDYS
ncbi:MAG: protein-L-isoaspartate O-methyltransferase [Candidatus Buchananbacteria bacterium CG10_big_fil_rev_8_21_14_0_10_42_9]|uniref:Protein-L-isoaspartate O-methyltransferase n=1 Tax=Candidatus Buchananbacteria bacterium CG10_big_fil_rev_8_21_14_0_10_42_9 TaxID=1974526 RepID=A0A2H0VZV0_9BACT|nr:MAG: protein-L-isoaspartate O-methyltransferase [Candidatus Buchananbacteria bacterium CG10_big_fil_rev_8_21_14_0_10_42_9]